MCFCDKSYFFVFSAALAALGCSSESKAPNGTLATGGSAGSGGGPATGGGAGTDGAGGGSSCPPVADNQNACSGPGYGQPEPSQTVQSVTASIVDMDGVAVPGVLAQVCGLDQCINVDVDGAGRVNATINKTLLKPAFKYGDGMHYGKLAYQLPDQGAFTLGQMSTPRLPDFGSCDVLAPGTEVSSNGVTIGVPAGGAVDFDTLTYTYPDERIFRAAEIPIAKASVAIDATLGFEIVWALAPIDTQLCPAAKLSVPNGPAWPAGTAVEFYVHGIDVSEAYAPYGGWAKASDGAVSADGTRVETSPGGGIPILSAVGIRKAP